MIDEKRNFMRGGHALRSVRRRFRREPVGSTPFRVLLSRAVDEGAAGISDPNVAILSNGEPTGTVKTIRSLRPRARIHIFSDHGSPDELHLVLSASGPYDLLIDNTAGAGRAARIRDLLFHLRAGGMMLLRRIGQQTGSEAAPERIEADREQLAAVMSDIGSGWASRGIAAKMPASDDRVRFGRSVGALELRWRHLLLGNQRSAQAKIREEHIEALLERRPDIGRVLAVRPAVDVVARCPVRMSSTSAPIREVPTAWTAPRMVLREYNDVLSAPGQLLTKGSIILPDSFRHWTEPRLRSRYVAEISKLFGDATAPTWFTQPPPGDTPRIIEEPCYYLDDEVRGHFGHMTTEVVSRLWGWSQAKAAYPDLRALMHFNKKRHLAGWETDLLAAAGIHPDEILFTYDPVRVRRMVAATPMFSNPAYAHPDVKQEWDRIGERLSEGSTVDVPRRIFIGRRVRKRRCINADEVDRFFADFGYTVIYPEDYSLADQVRMFRETDAVAGYAGSGLFNLMFAGTPKPVILVASESYSGRNEALIAGIVGHRLSYAWCRPEVERNGERYPRGSYQASYRFDFDREGRFVQEVVEALDSTRQIC